MENPNKDVDVDSIECFQNYSASEVFVQGLAGLVDQQDVESMIRAQKQMLQRFEKTNEMLANCNTLSMNRLKVAGQQFKSYNNVLEGIRKDVRHIETRIKSLKGKLSAQYPNEFATVSEKKEMKNEDLDESVDNSSPIPTTSSTGLNSEIQEEKEEIKCTELNDGITTDPERSSVQTENN